MLKSRSFAQVKQTIRHQPKKKEKVEETLIMLFYVFLILRKNAN